MFTFFILKYHPDWPAIVSAALRRAAWLKSLPPEKGKYET
jgi:hypothetical protein